MIFEESSKINLYSIDKLNFYNTYYTDDQLTTIGKPYKYHHSNLKKVATLGTTFFNYIQKNQRCQFDLIAYKQYN